MIIINQDKALQIRASELRAQRDRLLTRCDWAMMPDAPTDKAIWGEYRQALRDVTKQREFPGEILWPEIPK